MCESGCHYTTDYACIAFVSILLEEIDHCPFPNLVNMNMPYISVSSSLVQSLSVGLYSSPSPVLLSTDSSSDSFCSSTGFSASAAGTKWYDESTSRWHWVDFVLVTLLGSGM